jgi:micrococcal nuclease
MRRLGISLAPHREGLVILFMVLSALLLGACAAKGEHSNESDPAPRAASRQTPKPSERGRGPTKRPVAYVSRVIDGDTIEVALNGRTVDVRLIGIDTPETLHPTEPVECYGPAASSFATRSLEGDRVRLQFDVERLDQYGRDLAYVWDEGRLFNWLLVRQGFATVATFPPNVRYVDRFRAAQDQARQRNRGLWGACGLDGGAGRASSKGVVSGGSSGNCTLGYSPCLPLATDYDCAGGSGDGPEYARGPIHVTGFDRYELDYDGDGLACV